MVEGEAIMGFPAPLLPLWEKGLGDEGNSSNAQVASTFAERIAVKV
jgi:hypothetical protein